MPDYRPRGERFMDAFMGTKAGYLAAAGIAITATVLIGHALLSSCSPSYRDLTGQTNQQRIEEQGLPALKQAQRWQ